MDKIGNLEIFNKPNESGVAFCLLKPPNIEIKEALDSWFIYAEPKNSWIIAKTQKNITPDKLLYEGFDKIQTALDIFSVINKQHLIIEKPEESHFIWREIKSNKILTYSPEQSRCAPYRGCSNFAFILFKYLSPAPAFAQRLFH